jgi:hypothetical protein
MVQQLENEQRRLLNLAVQRARQYERARFAAEARQLRDEMLGQLNRTRLEFEERILNLQAELEEARSDLLALRVLDAKAQQQREEIWRDRMLVAAAMAHRDPTQLLH